MIPKKPLTIGICFAGAVAIWLISTSLLPKSISGYGKVQSLPAGEWGVIVRWNPLRPLADRTFRLTGLTTEFQQDGLQIHVTASVADVIGSGMWDSIAAVQEVTRQ